MADDNNGQVQGAKWLGLHSNKIAQYLEVGTRQVWLRRLALFALSIVLLAIPKLITGGYWLRVFVQAGLMIIMALGLNLIAGYTGLLNLGYAAFYAMGGYTYGLLASEHFGIHLPFFLLFPLAGVLAALLGFLLAIPGLSLKGDYLAVVTIAFGEIMNLLLKTLDPITGGPQGVRNIDHPSIFFYTLKTPRDFYYVVLFLCAVEMFLMRRLERSRIGRALLAIREDEEAAGTLGLNTTRLKLLACTIGAAPAGLAGVLFAGIQTLVSPESFTLMLSIEILSMVIIGGMGNASGVALGTILMTLLQEPLRTYTETYRMLIYGVILIIFVLFRPQGIWPRRYGGVSPRTKETESLAADNSTE